MSLVKRGVSIDWSLYLFSELENFSNFDKQLVLGGEGRAAGEGG